MILMKITIYPIIPTSNDFCAILNIHTNKQQTESFKLTRKNGHWRRNNSVLIVLENSQLRSLTEAQHLFYIILAGLIIN